VLRVVQLFIAGRPGDLIAVIGDAAAGFSFAYARIESMVSQPLDATRPADWISHQELGLDSAWTGQVPANPSLIAVFSRRAALFGYNAPVFRLLSLEVRQRVLETAIKDDIHLAQTEWPNLVARVPALVAGGGVNTKIDLDAVYPEALRGRFIMLAKAGKAELFRIMEVEEISRTAYALSSRVSRLTLDHDPGQWDDDVRNTSVLIQTEVVNVAESQVTALAPADASPDQLLLGVDCTLPVGRMVIVQGQGTIFGDASSQKQLRAEVAEVKRVDNGRVLVFTRPLRHRYDPQTLVILGNAVAATHGETKMTPLAQGDTEHVAPEIIGSGDARLRYQTFALRQDGLTYVGAANARGFDPALEVQVDDERRPFVSTLYGEPETSRAYTLEQASDGRTLVRFGGRLRTAANNVQAIYRVGGGSTGNLAAGRLVLPVTMPLGLREVTNPMPADGGADREGIASARRNGPIRVITLDRIVSLGDYEAFARAYAGITRAQATLVWKAGRQVVHLTVAGPDGANVPTGSDLYNNLARAIAQASAPGRAFRLLDYSSRQFSVTLAILSDPAFMRDEVLRDVSAALTMAYSAPQRDFCEPVAKSRLIACAQSCRGVIAARVVELRDDAGMLVAGELLGAAGATDAAGAELLTLKADGLTLQEMAP
jgi:hypothetical protein